MNNNNSVAQITSNFFMFKFEEPNRLGFLMLCFTDSVLRIPVDKKKIKFCAFGFNIVAWVILYYGAVGLYL